MELRNFLQGDNSVKPLVWIGDLGYDPQDWVYPWRIPPQGGPPYCGNRYEVRHGEAVGVPASGRSYGSGGARGGGDIRPPPP